jgi:peptidyl-prolyl cis-trans isomerase SurA
LRIEILEKRKQFTEAAREVSEDESTAAGGGELGYWKIGQLDAGYEQAALSLQPGEISEIVETQFGLHLIQLIEKKKDQYNTRHILIKRSANKQRVEELLEEMKKLRHRIIEEKVSFEKAVKKYAMADEVTKQRGGLLTGQEGGLQMPIDQLPAELGCLVDKMLPNTISEPALFTTDTGEQGARIVYLKEKIPSHRASLEKDYERIYQEASAAKKQKALESWLEAAKRTTIIQLDLTYEPAKELQQKYGKK